MVIFLSFFIYLLFIGLCLGGGGANRKGEHTFNSSDISFHFKHTCHIGLRSHTTLLCTQLTFGKHRTFLPGPWPKCERNSNILELVHGQDQSDGFLYYRLSWGDQRPLSYAKIFRELYGKSSSLCIAIYHIKRQLLKNKINAGGGEYMGVGVIQEFYSNWVACKWIK